MTCYSRTVLIDVLVYHWMTNNAGCGGCDQMKLGDGYPQHVADVYEASMRARESEPAT